MLPLPQGWPPKPRTSPGVSQYTSNAVVCSKKASAAVKLVSSPLELVYSPACLSRVSGVFSEPQDLSDRRDSQMADLNSLSSLEARAKAKIVGDILQGLRKLKALALEALSRAKNGEALGRTLLSGRRATTLRKRWREWLRFELWLRRVRGRNRPGSPEEVLDYLHSRAEEPCSKSALNSCRAAIEFVDQVGDFEYGVFDNLVVQEVFTGLVKDAGHRKDGDTSRKAFVTPVAVLIALERITWDDNQPSNRRVISWWILTSAGSNARTQKLVSGYAWARK